MLMSFLFSIPARPSHLKAVDVLEAAVGERHALRRPQLRPEYDLPVEGWIDNIPGRESNLVHQRRTGVVAVVVE